MFITRRFKSVLLRALALCCLIAVATGFAGTRSAMAMDGDQAVKLGFEVYEAWNIINYTHYDYLINEYVSPAKLLLDELDSPWWDGMLAAWRVATFNASSEVEYAEKESLYYDEMLINILYDDGAGSFVNQILDSYLDLEGAVNTNVNALKASTTKKLLDLGDEAITGLLLHDIKLTKICSIPINS